MRRHLQIYWADDEVALGGKIFDGYVLGTTIKCEPLATSVFPNIREATSAAKRIEPLYDKHGAPHAYVVHHYCGGSEVVRKLW